MKKQFRHTLFPFYGRLCQREEGAPKSIFDAPSLHNVWEMRTISL